MDVNSKPDLLLVLMIVLGLGIWMTSYGAVFFKEWNMQTMTRLVSR